ncbi:MAG: ribosome small subunit-dependent GTPase A [Bacteriovoracaceae bacterium]|jgi:ribosome biogenesis GTPase / thiamine phosphate phosphatase|nr:ribosome small subunit-dependent GTPase A [Bacteriovoracaceae bacterium]
MKARIYRSSQRELQCKIVDSGEIVTATAKGSILKKSSIVVGDYVQLEKVDVGTGFEYLIASIEPRESLIFRNFPRERKKKSIAANVDLIVVVVTVSKPDYKRGLLDRYLMRAFQWKVPTIVVFNKMDQYDPGKFDLEFESRRVAHLDVDTYEITAKDISYTPKVLDNGMVEFEEVLSGKTAIFLGQSGAGKSKIVSALSGGEISLLSKELAKVGKGAHTTTWSEILEFKDFTIIDSPGIRSFSMDDVMSEDIDQFFPDVAEWATHCQFKDCSHDQKARECFFYRPDLDSETDSEIALSRLESYLRIKEELERDPSWKKRKGH